VQDYLSEYGPRKVEANALVVAPDAGRALCRDAILRWLQDESAPDAFTTQLQPIRATLADELRRVVVNL
jgi:hypothetical protein